MKFMQTSDIRWGYAPDPGMPWSRDRAADIRQALPRILQSMQENGAELLLIAGGLFDSQPTTASLRAVSSILSQYPSIYTAIICGNRDPLTPSSALLSFHWPEHVHVFLSAVPSHWHIPELNAVVTGISRTADKGADSAAPAQTQTPSGDSDADVPAASKSADIPATPLPEGAIRFFLVPDEQAAAQTDSDFVWTAFGGGRRTMISGRFAGCSGSPEPMGAEDVGDFGILSGEINGDGRLGDQPEFIPMASAHYVPLTLRVTPAVTAAELNTRIQREITRRGSENIYLLDIRGERHPDEVFSPEQLQLRYRILTLTDSTEPAYNFSDLFSAHPDDMIGFYIRALHKPDMSPVEKKALYLGVRALLQTKKENV